MSARRCPDCERLLIPQREWGRKSRAERIALRPTHAEASARGLCSACYQRRRCWDLLADIERPSLSTAELLDEWGMYDYDATLTHTANVRLFAERLQRPYPTIAKALSRAGIRAGAA